MPYPGKRPLNISELDANHAMVSVHKYGFFLCRTGTARILLGSGTYRIGRHHLCLYTPNTFFQILEKSPDLDGVLEEEEVDTYYPVIRSIDIRDRLRIRHAPCVEISASQAESILGFYDMMKRHAQSTDAKDDVPNRHGTVAETIRADCVRHLRYALCLKVLAVYFENRPVDALPPDKGDAILNRFLVSLYKHCHKQRTVRYYAEEQNLSPYYFSSIIRERSGKSALQWIGDVTMIFARQYLAHSEMSVKEIADRLNFPDSSTFGRYFKHHEGDTPMGFRAKNARPTNEP